MFATATERANGLNMGRFLRESIELFSFLTRNKLRCAGKTIAASTKQALSCERTCEFSKL